MYELLNDVLNVLASLINGGGLPYLVGFAIGALVGSLLLTVYRRFAGRETPDPPTMFDHQPDDITWNPSGIPTEPEQFVTDEERVIRLLLAHNGRMKQTQIVAGTDWSEAKVSRILSEMEASNDIVRLEVGRQKVVCSTVDVPQSMMPAAKQRALARLENDEAVGDAA